MTSINSGLIFLIKFAKLFPIAAVTLKQIDDLLQKRLKENNEALGDKFVTKVDLDKKLSALSVSLDKKLSELKGNLEETLGGLGRHLIE